MIPEQDFLAVSCAVVYTIDAKLDIMASVPLYDRMWIAHMFMYRLYSGDNDPDFVDSVSDFIGTYLDQGPPPVWWRKSQSPTFGLA